MLAASSQTLTATFTPTDTADYSTANDSVSLTVTKAHLKLTAGNLSRPYNTANPQLTYSLSGFVNGDTASVIGGSPVLSTTAIAGSPPGNYPITVGVGTLGAANYDFLSTNFVNGTLTVTKATPVLTWAAPAPSLMALV